MKHGSRQGKHSALPEVCLGQENRHGDPRQDKANLGHGGAGQRPLEIDGEQGQHRAQHHGDKPQHQNQQAEGAVSGKHLQGSHQDTVHAHLGKNAREQGRCRRRCHRMGLGQPDMKREHAGLGAESQKDADTGGEHHPLVGLSHRRGKLRKGQGFRRIIEHRQTHKQNQAADHRNKQVGIACANRFLRLLMNDPGKAGKGENLEENEAGHKVSGKHHALRSSQCHQHEKPVAVQILPLMEKILLRKGRGKKPHHGSDRRVDDAESVRCEGEISGQNPGYHKLRLRARKKQHQNKLQTAGKNTEYISPVPRLGVLLFSSADEGGQHRPEKRQKHDKTNQHSFSHQRLPPAMAVTRRSTGSGYTPNRTLITVKNTIGNVILTPASVTSEPSP